MEKKYCWYYLTILLLLFVFKALESNAQNVKDDISKASALMGEGKYNEAYIILLKSTDNQAEEISDTCLAYLNYYKGSCLYFLKKYDEAIPCLQKSIQTMDKLHYRNCDYLEMMHGIGSCYKELGNYLKAEEYYRRTILRGNDLLNCAIRNQTYSKMAELYVLMEKPDLADMCTSRIQSEMRLVDSKSLESQIDDLYTLFESYDNQGRTEESISTLKKILSLIEENKGKNNNEYLLYLNLLRTQLRYEYSRLQEAVAVDKEMIDIGNQYKTYRRDICNAYEDYLRYLAENNKVDSIELILPSAVKYYSSTKDRNRLEVNLYEVIGNGLCDAENYDEGVKYLEKSWNGQTAQSIKALSILGSYYYLRNQPEKALEFYENAESQIEGGLEVNLNSKVFILERLVITNQRMGKTQDANSYFRKLEPLINQMNDNDYYSRFLIDWCLECVNSDNSNKAKELAEKTTKLLDLVSYDSKIIIYSQLGFVYIKTGDYRKSIDNNNMGIDMAIRNKGDKCIELTTLYHNLGRALMLLGDYPNALNALYKSRDLQKELEGEVMQRTNDYIEECESK